MNAAKDKVRSLALQSNPSSELILVSLEELSKTGKRYNSSEATVYEELYRQANYNKDKIDLPSFTLSVLGGKASDLVTKALSKCIKDKPASDAKKSDPVEPQSPLMHLYPQYGIMHPQIPVPATSTSYGYWPSYGYNHGPRRYRGQYRGSSLGNRGTCLFCDMPGHLVRDCQKMKAAKSSNRN